MLKQEASLFISSIKMLVKISSDDTECVGRHFVILFRNGKAGYCLQKRKGNYIHPITK